MSSLSINSLSVDKAVDKPVDILWISLWISGALRRLWISGGVFHSVSTGRPEFSTALSTGKLACQTASKPLIHSIHSPYYYYYYSF